MEHFICQIIRPIKRRSSKTALDKRKSMNKVLSVHTTAQQCLWWTLRDGQCYHGQDPYACKEFKQRANGIDLEGIATELKARLKDSLVLKYREQAERNEVTTSTDEVFTRRIPFPSKREQVSPDGVVSYVWFDPATDRITKTKERKTHGSKLSQVAVGGGRVNRKAPKSLCTKCGAWVQYPHDFKTLQVTCWLCAAKEVLEYKNPKPETPKPKEKNSNGQRSSISKRRGLGRYRKKASQLR